MSPRPEVDSTFRIEPGERYALHNRTPCEIVLGDPASGELSLPPLAERIILGARLAPFADLLRGPRQRHLLRVRGYVPPDEAHWPTLVVWVVVLGLLALTVVEVVVMGTLWRLEVALALVVAAATVAYVLWRAARQERARRQAEMVADDKDGDIEYGVGGSFYDGNQTAQRTKHTFLLLLVVTVGAVLPAIAIFAGTDMKSFVHFEGGLRVDDGLESRMASRVMQVAYTAVLSLFPALMYFQFDRQRIGTIRGNWVRAIFRMDPQMETLSDVDARYGDELSEASSYSTDSARFLGGKHSPIVVATILLTLGWTLLIIQTQSFDFAAVARVEIATRVASEAAERARNAAASDAPLAARAAATSAAADDAVRASRVAIERAAASVRGTVPAPTITSPVPTTEGGIEADLATAEAAKARADAAYDSVDQPLFQLLVPRPSAAAMAFLGAYFFAVYLVLRGYFRGDLRPKVYNQITTRLVTVVVLAYLLSVLYGAGFGNYRTLWALSFLAGVVPSTVLARIGVGASDVVFRHADTAKDDRLFARAFATPRSLTQIDGVDMYESARLKSEGINDIPSLATSDLVTAMVTTRLPIERLMDWADQAELIMLVNDGVGQRLDGRVKALRRLGIRTATDLASVTRRPASTGPDRPALREAVAAILAPPAPAGAQVGSPVDGDALLGWMAGQIELAPSIRRNRQWHASPLGGAKRCPAIVIGPLGTSGPHGAAPPGGSFATTA